MNCVPFGMIVQLLAPVYHALQHGWILRAVAANQSQEKPRTNRATRAADKFKKAFSGATQDKFAAPTCRPVKIFVKLRILPRSAEWFGNYI
jgi:hypothetical protein